MDPEVMVFFGGVFALFVVVCIINIFLIMYCYRKVQPGYVMAVKGLADQIRFTKSGGVVWPRVHSAYMIPLTPFSVKLPHSDQAIQVMVGEGPDFWRSTLDRLQIDDPDAMKQHAEDALSQNAHELKDLPYPSTEMLDGVDTILRPLGLVSNRPSLNTGSELGRQT